MLRIVLLTPILAFAAVLCYFLFLESPPEKPNLDLEEWWAPLELRSKTDKSIRPFKITFSEEDINDLKLRLKNHRPVTQPLEGIAFQYGFNTKTLSNWIEYWKDRYQFKEREKFLNQYPQFKTNIQGLDIHFIRVKPQVSSDVEIVPLLLLHGWCGSVREFYEAIPHLTATAAGRNYALEVIAPSLPGYGFSDAAVRPGMGTAEMAVLLRNLMRRLNHKKFYVQGGDWGAVIGSDMATLFPDEVLGYHTNMATASNFKLTLITLFGAIYPPLVVDNRLADRIYPLSKKLGHIIEESGYFYLQATKPDTVGIALNDSPSGLLAYILEKFSTWTDPGNRELTDGGLGKTFSRDQLLDNVMMYWISNSITTSMRLYAENMSRRQRAMGLVAIPTPVPTWVLQAKHEILYQPAWMLKFKYTNLLNVTVLEKGGHFLAFEQPNTFSEDVVKAVGEFRSYHRIQKDLKIDL